MEEDDHGTRKKKGRPPKIAQPLPAPPTPEGEIKLEAHPVELWQEACDNVRPIDAAHIAALAAQIDERHPGFGLYWVGRAILEASLTENIKSIAKVRAIVTRWLDEDSFGSGLEVKRVKSTAPVATATAPGGTRRPARAPRPGEPGYVGGRGRA